MLQRALGDDNAKATASLTKFQADAILSMRLQQLTGLEADKLVDEYKGLKGQISQYEAILANEQLILDLIRADMREMKQKYANPRRSIVSDEELGDYDKELLIREEYMVVTVTNDGYIKRLPPSTYRAQGRGGRGITATNTREGDFLEHMFVALTHDYILFFTDRGRVFWLKVYDIPDGLAHQRRPRDREPFATGRGREDHRIDPRPRVRRHRMPDDGHPPRDGQEDRADRLQTPARPRHHRARAWTKGTS